MKFLLAFSLLFLSVVSAKAEQKLALVVGIDTYENIEPLRKARNDARAVGETLEGLEFEVKTLIDPTRRELNRVFAEFTYRIQPGDVVVFFFAGHGIGMDGRNYLLPADAPSPGPGDKLFVASESIAADEIADVFAARGARLTFLILDACRNNPYPNEGARSAGGTQGLMRMDPAVGTFVLFSAGTGQVALDRLSNTDPDPNSVFTRALLPRLSQPGLTIHELVQEVRLDVRNLAERVRHDQFPAYYDQLSGSFSFNPLPPQSTEPEAVENLVAPDAGSATQPDACETARADWSILQNTESVAALRQFTQTYEACPIYTAAAKDRLQTLETRSPALAPTRQLSSCQDLWYARNLIYHQNGYCFQSDRARAVFDTSSCTTRAPQLSSAEMREKDRIVALEKAQGC